MLGNSSQRNDRWGNKIKSGTIGDPDANIRTYLTNKTTSSMGVSTKELAPNKRKFWFISPMTLPMLTSKCFIFWRWFPRKKHSLNDLIWRICEHRKETWKLNPELAALKRRKKNVEKTIKWDVEEKKYIHKIERQRVNRRIKKRKKKRQQRQSRRTSVWIETPFG